VLLTSVNTNSLLADSHSDDCLYVCVLVARVGRDSAVGIATCYGLDGPGVEFRWGGGRDFPQQSRRVVGPTMYNEHLISYPGAKQAGRDIDHLPPPNADVEERVKLYICSSFGP